MGWEALLSLSEADRSAVLERPFQPTKELALRVSRVPIGASDYALDRYTDEKARTTTRRGTFRSLAATSPSSPT